MTLALTQKDQNTATATPATSGSVAFANGKLYICVIGAVCTVGNTATFTAPVGGGLTWVNVKSSNVTRRAASIWCAYADAGATTGTLSIGITTGGLAKMSWAIEEVTGSAATAATNGLSAFGVTGAEQETLSTLCSVTLAAFNDPVNSMALGYHVAAGNAVLTAEGGYTNLSNTNGTSISHMLEYIQGQDLAVTATLASNTHVSVAAELKAAASAFVGMIPI